jgi:hypothetical protein
MYDYVIGVGGTGARCLEAITYLTATGLFTRPLYALMIDPDQNNGNLKRTGRLIDIYHRLQQCSQPATPTASGAFGLLRKALDEPGVFKSPVNHPGRGERPQDPTSWRNPKLPSRTFEQAIDFTGQPPDFKDFLRLFYQGGDLSMPLNIGYRGRTSIGAVALKLDLDGTVEHEGGGLRELVRNLQADLQNGNPRVFILGSVFGGTGAAALPTIPAFIKHLDPALIGPNVERLRFGCAMLIPYFSFPKSPAGNSAGPGPDSDEHLIATKAALLHYAHQQPAYEHVYLVGAPEQFRTADDYEPGDESQANAPHYVEFVSALAALNFFGRGEGGGARGELHFANDVAVVENQPISRGIFWSSLPAASPVHEEVKRRLVSFTTFAYFYKNFLHRAFTDRQSHVEAPWYRDNFRAPLSLSTRRDELNDLQDFCDAYLAWLHALGASGGSAMGAMFRWEALLHNETPLCAEYVGHLSEAETGPPRHMHDGYHQILKRMDALVLEKPGTQNPVGLLMYLLNHAVEKFCAENYKWR